MGVLLGGVLLHVGLTDEQTIEAKQKREFEKSNSRILLGVRNDGLDHFCVVEL